MSTVNQSSNVTTAFIDLATYDELEKYMYGGQKATTYFVQETKKATWFSIIPSLLTLQGGPANFGQLQVQWKIGRAFDYAQYIWLRCTVSSVSANTTASPAGAANWFGVPLSGGNVLKWTNNFMHNLIQNLAVTFNDLVAHQFDNYHLDFWAAFTVPAGKYNGYQAMIGNIPGFSQTAQATIDSFTLNLPIPVFFARDTGVALPVAALPYNDMAIKVDFRDWTQLLSFGNSNTAVPPAFNERYFVPATSAFVVTAPTLSNVQMYVNAVIVSNVERSKMGKNVRDILIEQTQEISPQSFAPGTNPNPSYDIRFSQAVKALFFAVRNISNPNEWSNYTTACPYIVGGSGSPGTPVPIVASPDGAFDPILQMTLQYENTQRLSNFGADYFSLIQPWYHAGVIPTQTGYHLYSYTLDILDMNPMASTNYGKLTNTSIILTASAVAIGSATIPAAAATAQAPDTTIPTPAQAIGLRPGIRYRQSFQAIVTCINWNIIRISGGALGFPVL